MKRNILIVIASILLIMFTAVLVTEVKSGERIKDFQHIKLQNRENELKLEQFETQKLKERLNDGEKKSQQELDQLRKEIEQRRQNEERLERELQAKLQRQKDEQDRIARVASETANAVTFTQRASAAPRAYSGGGNKDTWLAASGIPQEHWWAVDSIVSRESSWNPNAVNRSSGACGLGQQLPCGKWDSYGAWNDPVAALRAQHDYVKARYGGYPQAVAFWNANHWY